MSYLYDPDGRRVARLQNGSIVKQYYYDASGHMLVEANASGSWLRAEIYAGSRHLASWAGNATYFNHADWLGTERARSNSSGARCETITSLPFGDGQVTSGTCTPTPTFFTGLERDAESGLDHTLARQYGSGYGLWLSPDPENAGADAPDPQSWNAYGYVRGNPTSLSDPGGLDYRVCINTENGGQNCLPDLSNEEFRQLVYENNGTWVSFRNGQISVTINGKSAVIGSYEYFVGPKSEGGRAEDATLDLLNFAGAVEGGARGIVSISKGVSAFIRTFGETGGTGGAERLLPFSEQLSGRVAKAMEAADAGIKRFPKDGTVWENRAGQLPGKPYGYYKEYTVDPIGGVSGRGTERIVTGQGGEVYYTPSHYRSFVRIR
jgi:RHS repeat-associated protein